MAETKYEITYIIKPDLDEESKKTLIDRFDKVLTDQGATIVESKDWGKKRLAYEINKFREGTYHIAVVTSENADAVNEFDRLSKIDRSILRSMIVKLEA